MAKYRFKTEKEFRDEGKFNYGHPDGWVSNMNKFLGTDIPNEYNRYCDENRDFATSAVHGNWSYRKVDYVLKENLRDVSGFKLEDVAEIQI